MSDTQLPADKDDAGIFGLVVVATVATGAGLSAFGYPLWLLAPACVVYLIGGELAARQLAAMKWGQA